MLKLPAERWPPKKRFLSIPPDDAKLREELAVLPKSYDGDGRLRLPPKSRSSGGDRREPTVRELLGGRSPDRADALVLAAYVNPTRITRPLFKLESSNPTGSYKDRFAAAAVSDLVTRGVGQRLAAFSSGVVRAR